MRVLILASWYPKNALDTTGRFIEAQKRALEPGIEVKVVDCTFRLPLVPKALRIFFITLRGLGYCFFWKPNVIHAHVSFPAGRIGLLLKRFSNIPVVLTEHTGPLGLLEEFYSDLNQFNTQFTSYDKVIAVSSFLKKEITSRNQQANPIVVGNVVENRFLNTEIVSSVPQNSAAFIGRITEEKGIPELLLALEEFDKKTTTPLNLFFMGKGPLSKQILARTEGLKKVQVHFVEQQGQSDLLALLNKVSFLILPSRVETFSLISAEAIALGRPVVAFRSGGHEDFIQEENGILVEPYNTSAFCTAILEMTSHPKWAPTQALFEKRRRSIAQQFSGAVIQEKLVSIYRSLPSTER